MDSERLLEVGGEHIGELYLQTRGQSKGALRINFKNGWHLELLSAVDFSEQLEHPRVFQIEGSVVGHFLIMGGEKVYKITVAGELEKEIRLFRNRGEEEYWDTLIIQRPHDLIVIYEAGVLVIDSGLDGRFHKRKLFNDIFVATEGDVLKFVRDHDTEWSMKLDFRDEGRL
ncbi:MAG TPA: hypothetical protein VIF64_04295 [Pyrinomonadaceae bacterium]